MCENEIKTIAEWLEKQRFNFWQVKALISLMPEFSQLLI